MESWNLNFSRQKLKAKQTLKLTFIQENLRRANHNLKSKEESGETMTKIDFDQLEIENNKYQISLEEKNKEMIQV